MDIESVKRQIDHADRWMDILVDIAGVPREHLDGHHHPCPKCGGKDRFRLIDQKAGAVLCNQCFDRSNGDGIAAVQWARGCDFNEAIRLICDYARIEIPGKTHPEAKEKSSVEKLYPLRTTTEGLALWTIFHDPMTPEGVLSCHGFFGYHPYGHVEYGVVAFPIFGKQSFENGEFTEAKPVGYAMLPRNGKYLPAFDGAGKPPKGVKVKTLKGSKDAGWIGQVDRLKDAKVVWKVEGIKDMICLASCPELPADHAVITNKGGAKEQPEPWMIELLAGKTVNVVHDCDRPGQDGAVGWDDRGRPRNGFCQYIASAAADCRNIDLGAPITDDSGFDLKDWLTKGKKFPELLAIAEKSEKVEQKADPSERPIPIADDDPFRLARANLSQYEANGRRLIYWKESWYRYKDGHYQELTPEHIRSRIQSFCEAELTAAAERAFDQWRKKRNTELPPEKRKVTNALVANVIGATQAICLLDSSQEMDQWIGKKGKPDNQIAVGNGILNITKLLSLPVSEATKVTPEILQPHSSDWFSLAKVPYDYDPDAGCEYWMGWLNQVFDGDHEAIEAVQMWFGYLLSGRTDLHKIMFFVGPRRSGKGTISKTIETLFGRTALATPLLSDFLDKFGLETRIDKRICNINDVRICGNEDEKAVERLITISGGDAQDINRKFKSSRCGVTSKMRITMFSNLIPRFKDSSGAFASRFIFCWMPNTYLNREDLTVFDRISQEMPGILNWAIGGLRMLEILKRIPQPKSGNHLMQEMLSIMSPVTMFVEDECIRGSNHSVGTKFLFERWEQYCKECDISFPGTLQSFSRKLKAAYSGVRTERTFSATAGRETKFVGIDLKPEKPEEKF